MGDTAGRGGEGEAGEVGTVCITKDHASNCKNSELQLEDNVNPLKDYNQLQLKNASKVDG